jgi:hypothetical protein
LHVGGVAVLAEQAFDHHFHTGADGFLRSLSAAFHSVFSRVWLLSVLAIFVLCGGGGCDSRPVRASCIYYTGIGW